MRTACRLLRRSRATHYRHTRGPVLGPKQRRRAGPQALDTSERTAVLHVINQIGYGELSIGQIWIRELDENRPPRAMACFAAASRSSTTT